MCKKCKNQAQGKAGGESIQDIHKELKNVLEKLSLEQMYALSIRILSILYTDGTEADKDFFFPMLRQDVIREVDEFIATHVDSLT